MDGDGYGRSEAPGVLRSIPSEGIKVTIENESSERIGTGILTEAFCFTPASAKVKVTVSADCPLTAGITIYLDTEDSHLIEGKGIIENIGIP